MNISNMVVSQIHFNKKTFALFIILFLSSINISCNGEEQKSDQNYFVIDPAGQGRCAIGDIDGDGYNDVAVHKWGSRRGQTADGSLVWYKYPDWRKTTIKQNANFFGDGIRIVDIDSDGDNDIITCAGNDIKADVLLFRNPGNSSNSAWEEFLIGNADDKSEVKDIEVEDIDKDNKLDIVVRTKKKLVIYFQNDQNSWNAKTTTIRGREGMTLGDIDGDGDHDVVLNGFWLENPDDPRNSTWKEYIIDSQWFSDKTGGWQDYSVMVAVNDFNNDGKEDVVFSQSEKPGFFITWYETDNPKGGEAAWKEHQVKVVDYCHTLCAEDYDLDGDIDIVAGTLIRTKNPLVLVFLNEGNGINWKTEHISSKSVYKGKLGDIDNDGDFDLVSGLSWENPPIQLWRNSASSISKLAQWQRHQIDASIPNNAVFILHGDLDGDELIDIAAGSWWWKNPGTLSSTWNRNQIGTPLNNAALIYDFDNDNDLDILGTKGVGSSANHDFVWARNDGTGKYQILNNINTGGSGDFLQGIVIDDFGAGKQIALSWHNGGGGVQYLSIPQDPTTDAWTFGTLSTTTLKEKISAGDIDRDGDIDLLLGTIWLRNDESIWTPFTIGKVNDLEQKAEPDRNKLIDINGDQRLDAVIGLENGTNIFWFESPENPTDAWERHLIGISEGGGFSLDAADFDHDGDPDVVVGEHRGKSKNRVLIFENIGSGSAWQRLVIDSDSNKNIDHHDGTQAVDMDGDGDLDIISIGWYNKKVWIYENKSITLE